MTAGKKPKKPAAKKRAARKPKTSSAPGEAAMADEISPVAKAADANKVERSATPHRWKPGESGNPSGRPKVVAEVRDLARAHTGAAMQALVSIMSNAEAPCAARVAAAAHILDRGYGKPQQNISATVRTIKQMTDDELLAYINSGSDEASGGAGDFAQAGDTGLPN